MGEVGDHGAAQSVAPAVPGDPPAGSEAATSGAVSVKGAGVTGRAPRGARPAECLEKLKSRSNGRTAQPGAAESGRRSNFGSRHIDRKLARLGARHSGLCFRQGSKLRRC